MNKEITDTIVTLLTSDSNGPQVSNSSKYRGELEDEGSAWNPKFPSAFVQFLGMTPVVMDAGNNWLKKKYSYSILVADEYESGELAEEVYDYFDELLITNDDTPSKDWTVTAEKMELVGWIKRVEVYRVEISLV